MHEYMTRRMVAAQPMTYAGFELKPGDEFLATPIDGNYLTRNGRARDALREAAVVATPARTQAALVEDKPGEKPDDKADEKADDEPQTSVTPQKRAYTRRTIAYYPAEPAE